MLSVVFHCPTVFNDGKPVPPQLMERLERAVLVFADGFTVMEAQGAWKHEGRMYREPVLRYMVGLEEERVNEFVRNVERILKKDFGQIAVWFEVDGKPLIR